MTLLKYVLLTVLLTNIAGITYALVTYCYPYCDWCHRRYWVKCSTSAYPWVFCSYKCNYWDMRDHLAKHMPMDIAEVETYLSRHGWVHPDHIEVIK